MFTAGAVKYKLITMAGDEAGINITHSPSPGKSQLVNMCLLISSSFKKSPALNPVGAVVWFPHGTS